MRRVALLSVLFLVFSGILTAQCAQTNGFFEGRLRCFALNDTNPFVGTEGGGMFMSTSNGARWTAVHPNAAHSMFVHGLACSEGKLLAGTFNGVCISSGHESPRTGPIGPQYISAIALSGEDI